MLSFEKAQNFISSNARPFEKAAYEALYNHGKIESALKELRSFQNPDGGFGHALEADNWNPASNPIATNDAIIWLYRMNCLDMATDIKQKIINYLSSHDSFDEEEKRWLFAIESNKNFPHAIWWEKKDKGIEGFNPTVSLAAFMVCYGKRDVLYEDILKEALIFFEESEKLGGDQLKCFLLAYELLQKNAVTDIVDLNKFKALILSWLSKTICPDTSKYGVEYVSTPSDFFSATYLEFATEEIRPLIEAELSMLGKLQMEDGGFDISWQWYTPYREFDQARKYWRPRITLEKILFAKTFLQQI